MLNQFDCGKILLAAKVIPTPESLAALVATLLVFLLLVYGL